MHHFLITGKLRVHVKCTRTMRCRLHGSSTAEKQATISHHFQSNDNNFRVFLMTARCQLEKHPSHRNTGRLFQFFLAANHHCHRRTWHRLVDARGQNDSVSPHPFAVPDQDAILARRRKVAQRSGFRLRERQVGLRKQKSTNRRLSRRNKRFRLRERQVGLRKQKSTNRRLSRRNKRCWRRVEYFNGFYSVSFILGFCTTSGSVTCDLRRPSPCTCAAGRAAIFRGECCIDDESLAAPRLNRFLAPTH